MDYELNPSFQELESLEASRRVIAGHLTDDDLVTPDVRAMYERAAETLDDKIAAVAHSPELQDSVAQDGDTALQGRQQLEGLRGILPDDELEPQIGAFNERLQRVNDYFGHYGAESEGARLFATKVAAAGIAVSTTTETVPAVEVAAPAEVDDIVPPSPERDRSKTPVSVTFRRNVVQIGKFGQIVPFRPRTSESVIDHSDARRKALKYILVSEGELTPHQIWEAAYDGRPFDKDAFKPIRDWLVKITYRRQPIIHFNAKRGLSSRYSARGNLAFVVEHADELDDEQTVAVIDEKIDIIDEPDTKEVVNLPFDASNVYLAAHQLHTFNFVLEAYGYPTLENEVLDALEPYAPDLSHIRDDEVAIRDSKMQALENVRTFVDDDEKFLDYLDNVDLDPTSPTFKFFEYISLLDGPEQRELVDKLFKASLAHIAEVPGGKAGMLISDTEQVAVDEHGDIIRPPQPSEVSIPHDDDEIATWLDLDILPVGSDTKPDTDKGVSADGTGEADEDAFLTQPDAPESDTTGLSIDTVEEDNPEEQSAKDSTADLGKTAINELGLVIPDDSDIIRDKFEETREHIQAIADEIVDTIVNANMPENIGRPQIATTLTWFRRDTVKKWAGDQKGPRARHTRTDRFSFEEILEIGLLRRPEIKSVAGKSHKTVVKEIVASSAARIRADVEKQRREAEAQSRV